MHSRIFLLCMSATDFFCFCCGLLCLHEGVLVRSELHYEATSLELCLCRAGYARSGSLLPASAPRHPSTCSSGGASAVEVDEAIRQAQPRAVPATACCTATDSILEIQASHFVMHDPARHAVLQKKLHGCTVVRHPERLQTKQRFPASIFLDHERREEAADLQHAAAASHALPHQRPYMATCPFQPLITLQVPACEQHPHPLLLDLWRFRPSRAPPLAATTTCTVLPVTTLLTFAGNAVQLQSWSHSLP